MAHAMANTRPSCCVFIDNSNLFIEGQKTYAKYHDFLSDRDVRFRIAYGKLMKVIVGKRQRIYSALYGSEPPPIEKLWERVREEHIEVFRYNRGDDNSEKELDTDLTAHVTRKAIEMTRSQKDNLTFVIVAGDGDYISAFKQVMQEKFNLEIYTWKGCISRRIKEFAHLKNETKVTIRYLDQFILDNDVCYLADEWDREKKKIPPERSIVFKKIKREEQYTEHSDATSLTKEVTMHIRLPCKYWQPNQDTVIIIVVGDRCRMVDQFIGSREGGDQYMKDVLAKEFVEFDPVFKSIKEKYEINEKKYTISNYPSYLQTINDVIPSEYYSNTKAYDDEEPGEYTLVKKKGRKRHQKYSPQCKYKYACKLGGKCKYSHSRKEKEHFTTHSNHLGGKYKSKQCASLEVGGCTSKSCVFAHGLNEARCYYCDPGGKVGVHWMEECPSKNEENSSNL